ncbi:hypothetical protein ACQY0O_006408 [Thecaphora frezii]
MISSTKNLVTFPLFIVRKPWVTMSSDIEKQAGDKQVDPTSHPSPFAPRPSSLPSAPSSSLPQGGPEKLSWRMKACLLAIALACTAGVVYAYPARHQGSLELRAASSSSSAASASGTSSISSASTPTSVAPAYNTNAYTAPSAFPTSAFASYYFLPSGLTAEPRPVVTDVARHDNFPDSLVNPTLVPPPPAPTDAVFPVAVKHKGSKPSDAAEYAAAIGHNISAILAGSQSSCDKCLSSLKVVQQLAQRYPKAAPQLMVDLCKQYGYATNATCEAQYKSEVLGSVYTQVLSYADFTSATSTDAQYICGNLLSAKSNCSIPAPRDLDETFLDQWFGGKHRRVAPTTYKRKTGKPKKEGGNLKVLHMSDIHVDPRFFVGGEAACTNGRCCRADAFNSTLVTAPFAPGTLPKANISEEAVYWGNYKCDTPWSLVLAALESVTELNGGQEVDMTVHTGDMVVHDVAQYISKDLVHYTHQSVFDLMKMYLGKGPVFNALGNHDSAPSDAAAQHALPDGRGEQFSWDWDNVARLWQAEGWLTVAEAKQARTHYGGYSVSPREGLRVIAINTDFWYKNNIFNNIHTQDPDYSGTLRFLTDELFRAERKGERVWIVGHVLTGWDGSNPLDNPTNLFYQIVDRFAPHTIAHVFFGHTHEDQFNLFYTNNGTDTSVDKARMVSFMAPSVTPGNNVNPALRIMEVDPETYELMDWHQFYADVDEFADLEMGGHGPVFRHLYSAREAYGNFEAQDQTTWPAEAPLNATFWAKLTVEMEKRPELVQTFTVNQGRNSKRSPQCTDTACVAAKICYMRSGSAIIGKKCPRGYGSVQS